MSAEETKQDVPTSLATDRSLAFAAAPRTFSGDFFKKMDLREPSRILRRRIQIVLRMVALCAALGLIVSFVLTPQYRGEVVLLLDQRQAKILDIGRSIAAIPGDNSALRSEIDIITSRAVINRVINKLDLEHDPEFNSQVRAWKKWLNPSNWVTRQKKADKEAEAEREQTATAKAVQKKLSVSNDGRSLSLHLVFESSSAQKAALIANTIAEEYLVDQLEAKYEVTARANKWLSERLGNLRQQVEATERAVEDFRQKAKLIQIDGGTVATRQVQEINTQLITARAATSQAEARLRSAQSMVRNGGGIEGSADVLSAPLIQRLREQEAEVRRKEAELASRYGERHPNMINARAERMDIQRKIGEEVQKILRSLAGEVEIARAKENQLQSDLSRLEAKAGNELKDTVQLRQLQREADANRTLYENFLGRFKQTTEQQELQLPDTRIIARADIPTDPTFPKKWLFLIVSGIIGGLLGVIMAYLIEYFDRGYRTAPQLEEGTGLAVIGQVPSLRTISDRPPEDYVVDKPLSAYSESLRTVRTAIHFSNVDHPPKTVMVTSSGPGEGKTTFCLSMARSLAAGGNKILLIDADLRRPRLARLLEIAADGKDLSALLTGSSTMEDVLRHDPLVSKLDVIPAFGRAPNAQDLLGSKQMKKIIDEVSSKYDLVIVDTPPILAVSDAAMVGRVVDTSLFIVKWATTSRDTVVQALKQLKSLDCRIAGSVLNQVNLNEMASYGDGYYNHQYHEYYSD
ncbi:MAG: polysaccharide biosynthesis tyrosine autokinase [Alphaproteobacteria bacterium]|nr:polysaccharide biosynthesis tyrosine autokinase [Alphaproteobacteria bacterium]